MIQPIEHLNYLKQGHRILLQVPFFHTFGTVIGILVSLNSGSTLVLPALGYKPIESAKAIIYERLVLKNLITRYNIKYHSSD